MILIVAFGVLLLSHQPHHQAHSKSFGGTAKVATIQEHYFDSVLHAQQPLSSLLSYYASSSSLQSSFLASQQTSSSSSSSACHLQQQQQQQQQCHLQQQQEEATLAVLYQLRGGDGVDVLSSTLEEEQEEEEEVDDDHYDHDDDDQQLEVAVTSVVMVKVRHLIRSLIQICERQLSPQWAKSLQGAIQSLESMIGVPLLSQEERLLKNNNKTKKTKLKKKKKKKAKMSSSLSIAAATTTTTLTKKKKNKKTKKEESSETSLTEREHELSDNESVATTTKKKKPKSSSSSLSTSSGPKKQKASSQKKSSSSSSSLSPMPQHQHQHHHHLLTSKSLSKTNANYRIQRELKEFLRDPPPNLSVHVGKNIRIWIVTLQGVGIYQGESFRLRIQFPPRYPMVPPSVYFLPKIPIHEHVYTNGDICLSLLGDGWRPTMTAQSIAVSILSILASARSKALPMDNARHAQNKPGQYQKDWVYHDDNC